VRAVNTSVCPRISFRFCTCSANPKRKRKAALCIICAQSELSVTAPACPRATHCPLFYFVLFFLHPGDVAQTLQPEAGGGGGGGFRRAVVNFNCSSAGQAPPGRVVTNAADADAGSGAGSPAFENVVEENGSKLRDSSARKDGGSWAAKGSACMYLWWSGRVPQQWLVHIQVPTIRTYVHTYIHTYSVYSTCGHGLRADRPFRTTETFCWPGDSGDYDIVCASRCGLIISLCCPC
jgi:hypothetical protein